MEENIEDVNDKSFIDKVEKSYEKGFNKKPEFVVAANFLSRETQKIKNKRKEKINEVKGKDALDKENSVSNKEKEDDLELV